MPARIYLGDSGNGREKSLREAFDYIGLYRELSRSSKVFVKPNFTYPIPIRGVTTSREMLEDSLRLLSETGAEVFVGESNGGYGSFLASEAFAGHKLDEICKTSHAHPVDLSLEEKVEIVEDIGGKRTSVRLPRMLVKDVDFSVSIPVLKVHAMTRVSLSLKNLWGCYPTDLRLLEHKEIDRKLALISKCMKTRFGVVDALYSLDEHGPMVGTERYLGKFVAADDLLSLDYACAQMMGFNPRRISHLRNLAKFIKEDNWVPDLESNQDLAKYRWGFTLRRDLMDALSLLTFHSDLIAKAVFDSPATRPIYAALGREPRKKLLE